MSVMADIEIEKIRKGTHTLREVDKESESYLNLVDSVSDVGIMNPISVRPISKDEDGFEYEVIDGRHRFTAACDANLDTIPCIVFADKSEEDLLVAQIMTNVHKVETKPAEYAQQLRKIMAHDPMMSISRLVKMLCKSPTWINNTLKLTSLKAEIQDMVNSGDIKLLNAYALSRMPEEEQSDWVERAMTQSPEEFVPAANQRTKEIRESKRQGNRVDNNTFIAQPKLRKVRVIQDELAGLSTISRLIQTNEIADPKEAAKLAILWVLSLDEESLKVAQAKWDQEQLEKEERKEQRKRERDAQKIEKNQSALSALEA